MRPIGWYIHHHGAGHLTRFLAIRPHLPHEVVVFSSLEAPAALPPSTRWVVLPRDDDPFSGLDGLLHDPADAEPTLRGLLHWAPLGHPGHTARLAAIAAELTAEVHSAFVVDVSVEVALFVRLLGVPPIVVTQPGDRSDAPHVLAYEIAERILAPWPSTAHPSALVDVPEDRVCRVGGVSRFDGRVRDAAVVPGSVLVLGGTGDPELDDRVAAAEAATPEWSWSVIGGRGGWVDDPWPLLQRAEIVVTAAGQNSIADVAAAGARAIVMPQDRPFDEQRTTARHLREHGLAVVLDEGWPAPEEWPVVLEEARSLAPHWQQWEVSGAASRAAAAVIGIAGGTA